MEQIAGVTWLNDNQGVLSVILFCLTLIIGWLSGFFSGIRRRPKLRIELLLGPTFSCTFPTGKTFGKFDIHRTAIALYVRLTNVGSAPTSIGEISVGFRRDVRPLTLQWLWHGARWFWIRNQTVALADFQADIGDDLKCYPFLTQHSILMPKASDDFLEVGRAKNGVVYFEHADAFGNLFPRAKKGQARVRVRVKDAFDGNHQGTFSIPVLSLREARAFNPMVGLTLAKLRGEQLPEDIT